MQELEALFGKWAIQHWHTNNVYLAPKLYVKVAPDNYCILIESI